MRASQGGVSIRAPLRPEICSLPFAVPIMTAMDMWRMHCMKALLPPLLTSLRKDRCCLCRTPSSRSKAFPLGLAASGAATTTTSGATTTSAVGLTPPLATGAMVGAQTLAAATIATRDAASDAATRQRLYEQLALALIAAVLLGAALDWALTRRPRQTQE